MGGSGGGSSYSGTPAPRYVPPAEDLTPAQIVDDEITNTLAEARRVGELIDALRDADEDDFVLCALNAGQGDCCVMRLPGGEIVVVDCNVHSANVNLIKFLEKAGIKTVELLILTHPDRDHVSGLPALANSGIRIRNVVDGRFRKEDEAGERMPGYEEYRRAIEKLKRDGANFLPRTAIQGDVAKVGEVSIEFLAPQAPMQAADANQASLCFQVRFGKRTALFGGDVTQEMWSTILTEKGSRLKSDVFWASHHGADSGCLPAAVSAISPQLTVVSVGDNVYGHPHDEAMKHYEKNSSTVRRTDDGSIGIVSQEGREWRTIV